MPIFPVKITCEECGAERQTTNNWFSTFRAAAGGLVIEALNLEQVNEYVKNEFMMQEAKNVQYKAHCGEKCISTFLSRNLASLHTH